MLDFEVVQSALEALQSNVDASESHGTLCALLMDNSAMSVWLRHTLDDLPDANNVLAQESLTVLKQLFELSREQINTDDLGLELLLPDDEEDFGVRLLGLSGWCQGFLYGIGVLGENRINDAQAEECLADMLEISQIDHREEDNEDAQQQFIEIAEHVRMSVLMMNELINPTFDAPVMQ